MKKARIELVFAPRLVVYFVTKLVNCATFTPQCSRDVKMIGSTLSPKEAESVALDRRFEVSITQEK
jgi:hypothetical protein